MFIQHRKKVSLKSGIAAVLAGLFRLILILEALRFENVVFAAYPHHNQVIRLIPTKNNNHKRRIPL